MCVQYAHPPEVAQIGHFPAIYPENRTGTRSEVEDDAGDALEVVLVLAEEVVEHVIAFGPQGQSIISSPTGSPRLRPPAP